MQHHSISFGAFLIATATIAVAPALKAQISLDSNSKAFVYHHTDGTGNSNYYSYAPSVIADGSMEYIYTCHNSQAGQIVDNIWLTEINTSNGQIAYDQAVLQPTAGAWDSVHTCDPSVIKSNVSYNGRSYAYVMFYLGTDQSDNNHNQIGLALANAPEGPWTKFPSPVVTYNASLPNCYTNQKFSCWGVGQPTVTSVDGNGRILLFWSGAAGANRGDVNIGVLNDSGANPVWNSSIATTSAGLTDLEGNADWLNNYDMAYDASRNRFYAVREQHDNSIAYCSPSSPTYICQNLQLVSIDGSSIWNGRWFVAGGGNDSADPNRLSAQSQRGPASRLVRGHSQLKQSYDDVYGILRREQ